MTSVLLTVLEAAGIALLVIFGIISAVLLAILFMPVRYSAGGNWVHTDIVMRARATWLLHAVSFRVEYDTGQAFHMWLNLFGFRVYDNRGAGKRRAKNKKQKPAKTKAGYSGEIQAASVEEDADIPDEKIPAGSLPDGEKRAALPGSRRAVLKRRKTGKIFQKINQIFANFVNFFQNIKFTFFKICDTIGKARDNITYYLKLFQLDSTKRALSLCRKHLGTVLKKMCPKKYRVNLHLGFGDPAAMGEALAVWGMLYPLHQGNVNIEPEFEDSVMEGDFSLKGRISVYVLLRAALILFFDKDVKRLGQRLKRNQ